MALEVRSRLSQAPVGAAGLSSGAALAGHLALLLLPVSEAQENNQKESEL